MAIIFHIHEPHERKHRFLQNIQSFVTAVQEGHLRKNQFATADEPAPTVTVFSDHAEELRRFDNQRFNQLVETYRDGFNYSEPNPTPPWSLEDTVASETQVKIDEYKRNRAAEAKTFRTQLIQLIETCFSN